jgi:hypothetical protein
MNQDALANRSSRIFWLIRSSKVLMISAFDLKLLVFGFLAVCSGLGVSDASGRASAQLASAEAGSHSDGSSDPQAVGGRGHCGFRVRARNRQKTAPGHRGWQNRFIGPLKFLFQLFQIYVFKSGKLQL